MLVWSTVLYSRYLLFIFRILTKIFPKVRQSDSTCVLYRCDPQPTVSLFSFEVKVCTTNKLHSSFQHKETWNNATCLLVTVVVASGMKWNEIAYSESRAPYHLPFLPSSTNNFAKSALCLAFVCLLVVQFGCTSTRSQTSLSSSCLFRTASFPIAGILVQYSTSQRQNSQPRRYSTVCSK